MQVERDDKPGASRRLSESVCVITGSGGSLGRATALAFAREGASVVGCDLTVEAAESTVEMVRGAGGEIVSMQPCRLDDPADCQSLIDLALGTYGRIDVLCNFAATAYFNWLEDITDEEWDRARWGEVDVVFYLTRAAWAHLKASGGVIVNMASLNASLSFKLLPALAHTTNKAGIVAMTRQLAMEGREHGIRANSISPGLIETGATRAQLEDRNARQDSAGPPRPTRGGRERRPVPCVKRQLIRHRGRHRRRRRDEGLVTWPGY
jgi:NAD(P)-dependent dehydrogenase (short-subunit alcohol dehydrogenase family)